MKLFMLLAIFYTPFFTALEMTPEEIKLQVTGERLARLISLMEAIMKPSGVKVYSSGHLLYEHYQNLQRYIVTPETTRYAFLRLKKLECYQNYVQITDYLKKEYLKKHWLSPLKIATNLPEMNKVIIQLYRFNNFFEECADSNILDNRKNLYQTIVNENSTFDKLQQAFAKPLYPGDQKFLTLDEYVHQATQSAVKKYKEQLESLNIKESTS